MQKILIALVAIVLIVGGGYFAYAKWYTPTPEDEGVVCTMEAKMCPDGSYVGRTGPHCEFSACPTSTATTTTVSKDTKINTTITAFNFSITPTQVLEDSRCPLDVQCIQAGTVRVKTTLAGELGEYSATLELNKPLVNEEVSITLTSVSPAPNSKHAITPEEYVFTFEIKKI